MNHSQTDTLIAAWREDADTARKAGHEQTAREIEAAAGLFERQASEIKTLRENNAALQAELDDGHAELREERDALGVWLDECLLTMRHASQFLDESNKGAALAMHEMDRLSSRSRRLGDSIARRDARMKAEALEEFENRTERFGAIPYSDLVRRLQVRAYQYRKQAEGEL